MNISKSIINIALVGAVAVSGIGASCQKPTPKEIATHTLDVAQIACVLVHEFLEDESAVARACDIATDYIPDIRKLLQASKQAKAIKAAAQASAAASALGSASAASHK